MYIVTKNLITDKYDVGYFDPYGTWHNATNSSYKNPEHAEEKARYLNGGDISDKWKRVMFKIRDWGYALTADL